MKELHYFLASTILALLLVTIVPLAYADPLGKVTICHATESATNPFVTIHVSENAIKGHFENNGTPDAGHEDDILFDGEVECPLGNAGGGGGGTASSTSSTLTNVLLGIVISSSSTSTSHIPPTPTSTPSIGTLSALVVASNSENLTDTIGVNTLTGTVSESSNGENGIGGGGDSSNGSGGGGGRGGGGGNNNDDGLGGGGDVFDGIGGGGDVSGVSIEVPNTGAGGASTESLITLLLSAIVALGSFRWLYWSLPQIKI